MVKIYNYESFSIWGMKYRKVCNCEKQPCIICFCLFTLYIKQIEYLLEE